MYFDKKKKHTWRNILILAIVLTVAALVYSVAGGSGKKLNEEGAAAIKEAIRRSALQCYVVEGIYPPNLSYLEDYYGLQVNREDYYITYDAFASNLPPNIVVSDRD